MVHVIHEKGTENISDAQIQSQIDVLNEDFRKVTGTNGDGNGVDTEIEFCLAKISPNGKCTNGIVRIESDLTDHQTYQRSMLKDLSFWDNKRYLNIYVVKDINNGSGTLGYSSFPGGPDNEDGIVIKHNAFGTLGTVSSSYNLGRTLTHEVGHWIGLYHTFNGGCGTDTCIDGDYVCDTPPVIDPNYSCSAINSCNNDVPDLNDQIENYMDYTPDACKNMFTAGQKSRMDATLNTYRWNIWQYSNIVSTGCDSSYISPNCNAVADFTSNAQNICVGNPINFINKSLNNCTTYQWYFPGGNPISSIDVNPVVTYDTVGMYDVSLVATNSMGVDSITFSNYISVEEPSVGQTIPFSEDFETSSFPPSGIVIDNPDYGVTWELDTIAVQYAGLGSAKINNLININYGQSDALILPSFDLTAFTETPYLSFRWAYAKSDANYSDELIVLLSIDCGVNFIQIFYKTGSSMTTGTTQTTEYIPDSNTVWKMANINLSNYTSASNAIIKIVNVTDGGNNLYIDHINVGTSATAGINEFFVDENSLIIYPNPFSTKTTIKLDFPIINNENTCLFLYDMLGKEIKKVTPITKNFILERNNLLPGIYFVKIQGGNSIVTKKLIVN